MIKKLMSWFRPECPNGGHKQNGLMVENCNGNSFCWHPECMRANYLDTKVRPLKSMKAGYINLGYED